DNSDSFEILAAALAAADLTEILSGEGPFTIFAPTDDAFAALPEGAVDQLLLPENKDVLVQILTYHVVPGALLSTDLETGNVATVEGSDVAVDVADTVTVNNANVVVADVEASNGIIHIIDRVIIPPSPEVGADAEVEEAPAMAQ
ncbi:MAG: fasciclin domain-containing protein, partial [Phormidesmis sp.]